MKKLKDDDGEVRDIWIVDYIEPQEVNFLDVDKWMEKVRDDMKKLKDDEAKQST